MIGETKMKKVIYFDCYMGISGDMVLGACLDLGVDLDMLNAELAKLHVDGFKVTAERIVKNGFTGTDAEVVSTADGLPVEQHGHSHTHGYEHVHGHSHDYEHSHDHPHEHRTFRSICDMIMNSDLKDSVKDMALSVFRVIAEAEARVHGKSIEEVGFHEVGALDSIVDICGAAVCMDLLGVEGVYCSVVREGSGFIMCQHGQLPVPVPAVANMMPGSGIVIRQTDEIHTELVTPTGFGILKGMKAICDTMPEMVVEGVGIGFGKRDVGRLNGLRAVLGTLIEPDEAFPKIDYDGGHTHEYGRVDGHAHSAEHIRKIRNRLAKAIGHLERVKHMVEDDRDCSEVLIQLAAVKSALNNTGKEILKEHMSHCLIGAIERKQFSEIEELNKAIDQFVK